MTKLHFPDPHHDSLSNTTFGFWVYLMTDAILFVTLFATYAVFNSSPYSGGASKEIFNLPVALGETIVLLMSSFSCGLAMLAASAKDKNKMLAWFSITFILGLCFLILEVLDFKGLIQASYDWKKNAFLSSYFTLIGTHGLHIGFGLLFLLVFILQFAAQGFSSQVLRRLTCFSMFWYFSYVIWIFMFTLVYLVGGAQ